MSHDAARSVSMSVGSAARPVRQTAPKAGGIPAAGFARDLAQAAGSLRFSAHAASRLESRNIRISAEEMVCVEAAAERAAEKGSRDTLLMMDDLGLIVNIKNRTVLTAIDLGRLEDGVVTNIDSTVMVRKDASSVARSASVE
jgi:flagellar operon protein